MKLKEALRRLWRNVEAFGYALEYDPLADIASRFERLEREVAHLNVARSK